MYEADERPKFERNSSIKSLRRTMSQMSSKSAEDPDAEPEFKGYKYIGDPVDVIKYNVSKYKGPGRGSHFCDLDLSKDEVDNYDRRYQDEDNLSEPNQDETRRPVKLGFDLMSLNGYRGHFIDNVEEHSRAEQAGLRHGDLVLEINGTSLLPLSHDEVVELIKQLKDDPIQSRLRMNVISSPMLKDTLEEEVDEEG